MNVGLQTYIKTILLIMGFCYKNFNFRKQRFSDGNDMIPGIPPHCLRQLNFLETLLIFRAIPFIRIYNTKFLGSRMEGNCINIFHTPENIVKVLPRNIDDLKINILKGDESSDSIFSCVVRPNFLLTALEWLKINNPAYNDIIIILTFLLTIKIYLQVTTLNKINMFCMRHVSRL